MDEKLPYFVEGKVVKGFGRGSKELGIPTANFPVDVVRKLPEDIGAGVYYGWAAVDEGPLFKMVMSIGWNPYYNNTVKSMETHIIHEFKEDFYGSILKVCMLGYLRPMRNFGSLDELITAIKKDVSDSEEALEKPENQKIKQDNFFSMCTTCATSSQLASTASTQPGSTQPGASQLGSTQPGSSQPGSTQPGASSSI